jgi:putative ABC transport system ATP-binding protein
MSATTPRLEREAAGRRGEPVVQARGLTREFGAGRTLVRAVADVDLDAWGGEVVLVMGPSGSGKTTLLTMLGALLRPTAGSVRIEGLDVTALDRRELARVRRERVGFVFQAFNLLDALSARENVQVALDVAGASGAEGRRRATDLLIEAGLGDRADLRASHLSGGERQRVSIARALANRPRLLLADEPTANLDAEHGLEVAGLLRRLARSEDACVVLVSHDERLRTIADRVLRLVDGRLIAAEPPAGLADVAVPRRFP